MTVVPCRVNVVTALEVIETPGPSTTQARAAVGR
jgi:hypothetical protein